MNVRAAASTTHIGTGDCSNTNGCNTPEAARDTRTGRRSGEERGGVLGILFLSIEHPSGQSLTSSICNAVEAWVNVSRNIAGRVHQPLAAEAANRAGTTSPRESEMFEPDPGS